MLEIIPSRTGPKTAIQNGVRLHSAYDPVREAERFAAHAVKKPEPGTILLLGAGLGYLVESLRAAYPRTRLLTVFYSREISNHCSARSGAFWDPESPEPLSNWLRGQIAELDTEGLLVLEWPASARMFPRLSVLANKAIRQLLQEHRGSLVTTMAAGRQWLANGFINAVTLDNFLDVNPQAASLPIVVAASGPSLEKAAAPLKSLREHCYLWALPSAVPFLISNGLTPDLIVVTDPSFYALYHLHSACGRTLNLAMPLSAATGAWRLQSPVFLLSQGDFAEAALLELVGFPAPAIPPQGTVAATALELGLRLGSNALVFAGLDLCHLDIRAHVRPNAFESFLAEGASRLSPLFSRLFTRSLEQAPEKHRRQGRTYRTGLTLRTYGGRLTESAGPGRLFRLNPTPIPLEGMTDLDNRGLETLLSTFNPGAGKAQFVSRPPGRPRGERRTRALALLSAYEKRLSPPAGEEPISALFADSLALSLVYTITPGRLARTKQLLRRFENKAAGKEVQRLLDESRGFLQDLKMRLGSHDDF
jgi:hypothetical protein